MNEDQRKMAQGY